MLLLLPPSETKSPGGEGPPVDCDALVGTRLGPTRRRVLKALAAVSKHPAEATSALKLLAVVDAALAANRVAATSPTRPALDRYTGVVYAGLDVPSMRPDVRALADSSTLVFSGLFGIVRGSDPVPDYRVPVSATLPTLGPLTPVWRAGLRDAMPAVLRTSFAVDLRSTDYSGMWVPTGPIRHQVLGVRVLSPRPSGPPRVVSHFSKHGKGVLARALLEAAVAGRAPRNIDDVAGVAAGLGWAVEQRRNQGGVPALDVVLPKPAT